MRLYNFSSTRFPLIPGKKLIAAMFYRLEEQEIGNFPVPESPVEDFPDDLIRLIQGYRPVAPQGLYDALTETRRELAELKAEITSGKDWQREFRDSLQTHSNQIGKLLEGLREEKDNRSAAQRDFDDRLRDLQREVYKNASRVGLIIGAIVVIAGAIAQFLLPRLFGP